VDAEEGGAPGPGRGILSPPMPAPARKRLRVLVVEGNLDAVRQVLGTVLLVCLGQAFRTRLALDAVHAMWLHFNERDNRVTLCRADSG